MLLLLPLMLHGTAVHPFEHKRNTIPPPFLPFWPLYNFFSPHLSLFPCFSIKYLLISISIPFSSFIFLCCYHFFFPICMFSYPSSSLFLFCQKHSALGIQFYLNTTTDDFQQYVSYYSTFEQIAVG